MFFYNVLKVVFMRQRRSVHVLKEEVRLRTPRPCGNTELCPSNEGRSTKNATSCGNVDPFTSCERKKPPTGKSVGKDAFEIEFHMASVFFSKCFLLKR